MTNQTFIERHPPVSNVTRLTVKTKLDAVFEIPDGSVLTFSTRPGIVTVRLEHRGELHWQQVHRYEAGGSSPAKTAPQPKPDPKPVRTPRTPNLVDGASGGGTSDDAPRRRGGRPRLYPEKPKPLTLDQVIGAEEEQQRHEG